MPASNAASTDSRTAPRRVAINLCAYAIVFSSSLTRQDCYAGCELVEHALTAARDAPAAVVVDEVTPDVTGRCRRRWWIFAAHNGAPGVLLRAIASGEPGDVE